MDHLEIDSLSGPGCVFFFRERHEYPISSLHQLCSHGETCTFSVHSEKKNLYTIGKHVYFTVVHVEYRGVH